MKCERCNRDSNSLCTESHDNKRNIHFIADKDGICNICKRELGFKTLRQIDGEYKNAN